QGTLHPSTIVMPAGVTSQLFSISYSAVDNGVIVHAAVAASKHMTVQPGATASFDVLAEVLPLTQGNPNFATGVGVGDAGCSTRTTEPECGIIVLPNDIQSPAAA